MWPIEWELEAWFAEVTRRRKDKYPGSGDDDVNEPPMAQNKLTAGRRR